MTTKVDSITKVESCGDRRNKTLVHVAPDAGEGDSSAGICY